MKDKFSDISIIDLIDRISFCIKFLLKKWKSLAIICIIAFLVGVGYSFTKKPVYTAELNFVAEADNDNQLKGYASIASQFGFNLGGGGGGGAFEGDNLLELLKSKNIIFKTLLSPAPNKDLFINLYLTNNQINKDWNKDSILNKVKFYKKEDLNGRIEDSVLLKAYKSITEGSLEISRNDKKLNFINLKYSDLNEDYAKDFLTSLLQIASNYYIEYKSKKGKQNVDILQKQTDSVMKELHGSVSDINIMGDVNVNPIKQQSKTKIQFKQIDQQIDAALYTELLKNLELAKITVRKETPLIQIIDEPMLPLKKVRTGKFFSGLLFSMCAFIFTSLYMFIGDWYTKQKHSIS